MDGNGRWASRRGLADGRRAPRRDARAVRRTVEAAIDLGIHEPRRVRVLDRELVAAAGRGRRADGDLRARRSSASCPISPSRACASASSAAATARRRRCARRMEAMEDRTELNTRLGLWIAFDYGGRAELVEAARRIAESGVDPREIDENVFAAQPLRAGAARSRPADPHERRAARLELHALAARLRGARLRRQALAGLRRARPARRARGVRAAPPTIRRHDEQRRLAARRRGRRCCRSCSAPSTSAAGGCSRSSRSLRRRAARVLAAGAAARPLAPAGYVGGVLALVGAQLGGVGWMVGGVLIDASRSRSCSRAISEARARPRRRRSRRR